MFKIDIDEETKFRLGCAVNFQQLFSRGNFFVKNDGQSSTSISNLQSSAKSKTSFGIGFQPVIGIDFMLTDNFGLGLDFALVRIDWNKSLKNMHFNESQHVVIPDHKTSNAFIAGRIIF